MKARRSWIMAISCLSTLMAGCGAARSAGSGVESGGQSDQERVAALIRSRSDSTRYLHTEADVYFMSGMIPHHAQAVLISGWVESRSTRQDVKVLAQRIIVGQRDEIGLMRRWLAVRKLPVPDSNATHHRMNMGGSTHEMLMPGMLTEDDLTKLRNSQGVAFDRLFLQYMIKHHAGAITMVEELFKAPGAGQDDVVFGFASDVYADQTTEIDRMERILASLPPGGDG